jgi:hypothetical protein
VIARSANCDQAGLLMPNILYLYGGYMCNYGKGENTEFVNITRASRRALFPYTNLCYASEYL